MGRLGVARPVIIGGFLIGGFSLIGIPFMAAFYSKEPIIETLFTRNFLLTGYFLILRGVCLTCLYSLRLLLLSGIFLVRHCSTIHLLERIKRIIRISLLFLPSFFRGVIFSNLFSFLRFEGLVNRNVKLVICAFIIFRFLPLSNINLMFKRSDSLNKNYLHP
jgi:NADH:ubiquinone oxidoreductase subunit 5 (subunit L)/multisubunit Na+/H+ antiporter MnhA subunit